MKPDKLLSADHAPANVFDAVILIVLVIGVIRGRKNGMSAELMLTLQWLAGIFAGAFLYKSLGGQLAAAAGMSHLFSYLAVYVGLLIACKIGFALIKKSMGGKAISSDTFGKGEYYLGMVAGMLRWLAMLVAALAMLNAPFYNEQEVAANTAKQKALYGKQMFPDLPTIQQMVFKESFCGPYIRKYAGFMLIAPTAAENTSLGGQKRKDDFP